MDLHFGVSEFVALVNQTLEYAYNSIAITGELANFRVSKNRWVYFDLKDDQASVRFFGTVYQLPGPLEDGMMLEVRGNPRLHPQFGFSVTVQAIRPVGEGSIKKAATLLQAKLEKEGLFARERKRPLPYPPVRVGLITSNESAAYRDFIKILNTRWSGIEIILADVQVQGEAAPGQVAEAVMNFNQLPHPPEVLVVTRGGGSADDLAAFSDERVVRAIAASRIPTLVAIGHEVDVSLAELAADKRASTPSNAAELLVPDKQDVFRQLRATRKELLISVNRQFEFNWSNIEATIEIAEQLIIKKLETDKINLLAQGRLLAALDPRLPLRRGYALIRLGDKTVRRATDIAPNAKIDVEISDAVVTARVESIHAKR